MSNNTPNPLTREKFAQLVAAVQRIGQLANTAIKTPNDDAEIAGQKSFLARALFEHSGELLQSWYVLTEEYTPLVRGFAAITDRAAQLKAEREAQFAAAIAQAKQQPETGNAAADAPPADPNIIAPDFVVKQ